MHDSVSLLLSAFLGLSVYPANQAILCGALIHFLHAAYGLANHFAIHHPATDNKQAGKPSPKTCSVHILLHVAACLNAQFPVQRRTCLIQHRIEANQQIWLGMMKCRLRLRGIVATEQHLVRVIRACTSKTQTVSSTQVLTSCTSMSHHH